MLLSFCCELTSPRLLGSTFRCVVSRKYDQTTLQGFGSHRRDLGSRRGVRTSHQSPRISTKTPATKRCAVVYFSTPSMIGLSFLARFSVGRFEVLRRWHQATQRHQRAFSFQYHNKAVPCPRMVYPPRNLVQKIARCVLHASRPHHPIPNLYALFLLPPTPQTTRTFPFHRDTSRPARKVAQFSGATEYIDKQDCVVEDLGVLGLLAEDGSSVEVLSGALLKSMNQPIRQVLNIYALRVLAQRR